MARLLLVLFALASLALPFAVALAEPADPREGAAIVFAPWISQAEAFARIGEAGGAVVRAGYVPFVAVAIAEDSRSFTAAMRDAGAIALLDPRALALCATPDRMP